MGNTATTEDTRMIVGYARVSTPQQKLARQVENIKNAYPDAVVIEEKYTGTTENRPKYQKLLKQCRNGLVKKLVFDEVSRMSRNAEEGIATYKELYELGIEIEFIKQPHLNSEVYRTASQTKINIDTSTMDDDTAKLLNTMIGGLNDFLFAVAGKQIKIAFESAQAERDLLSKRTSEGLKQAKLLGSQVGRKTGTRIVTKQEKKCKKDIRKYYEKYGGALTATQCIKLLDISKSTFYGYLKELEQEDLEKEINNETES